MVAMFALVAFVPVSAATAEGSDQNVDYTYWDQGNIYTYWSGVYNKINYNMYSPCIGTSLGGKSCGSPVPQSTYGEHNYGVRFLGHYHYLKSAYDTEDYVVR